MNIGEVARATGISAKLIRYYESVGLIGAAKRSTSGYRVYAARDIHVLDFIKCARSLGFSMLQIEQLLALWQDDSRRSADVKALALEHIAQLEQKIQDLHDMVAALRGLTQQCKGDVRPDCPILEGIGRLDPGLADANEEIPEGQHAAGGARRFRLPDSAAAP